MSGDRLARLVLFSGCIWGFGLGTANLAQIVPDNTLGSESSIVVDDSAIDPGQIVDLIKSGAIRGETLFHSFEEFNVSADRQVYFDNPNGIEQIVTRVTGNNPSRILGRLGVNGNASLFLLNPNDILFSENASLDVGGSFVATTADSLVFDDDLVYSATNPETPPLLNVTIPEGIQFGADAGRIEVQGEGHTLGFDSSSLMPTGNAPSSGLKVPTGRTLALIARELNLNGGNLSASEGNIELAAIAQSGEVELEQDNELFAFDYDAIDNFGEINLFQQSLLDVRGGKNLGSVGIRGNNIALRDSTAILASKSNPGRSQTEGKIELVATNFLIITNNAFNTFPSGIFTQIEQTSNHPGADIQIDTDRLELQNNALIVSTVTNKGQGGNININARQIELIDNFNSPYNAGIYSQALSGATGDVGIITVEANDLQLLDDREVILIDDEDDLEDLIGEDRAENFEDAIEDNEDLNIVIGTFESGKRSLNFTGGGEITSINRGSGENGIAIVTANTIQFSEFSSPPEPEVPTPEISEPEVPTPEISEPEVPTPEISEPEVPTPEISEPEVPISEVPTPETPTPEVPTSEVPTPEAPEIPTPEVPTPEVPTPEVPTPEISEPEAPTSETPTPEVPTPEISEPEVPTPEVPTPEISEPEAPTSETPTPEVPTPEISEPEAPTSETPTPEVPTPEISEPEVPTPEAPEIPTPEVPTPETPTHEVPTPEISEPEVPISEVPTPEVPEVITPEAPSTNQDLKSDRVYVFELSSGQTIMVNAKDLIKAAQSESIDSLTNSSSNTKSKSIEIYNSNVSRIETSDPDFDFPSACRLGDNNFVIIGKGGMAENPFSNLIQEITVPDIEAKVPQQKTISATEPNTLEYQPDLIVEAQNWQINRSGKVELLASSSQQSTSSLAGLPNCLKNHNSSNSN